MRRRSAFTFWALALLTLALVVVVAAPFAVVVAGAVLNTSFLGLSTEAWSGDAGQQWFTFHWLSYVWELYHGSFYFSLRLALLSTGLCLVIGVPAACALSRETRQFYSLLEGLILLPLALPGVALSIGLIQAYAVIRGSWILILGGHLLYTLPFMVRTVLNALRSFDHAALDLSARGLGASPWQRFTLVLLPNLRHAMMTGALMAFAVSWGEFNVSYLLNTPLHQTFPAALYATYTSNSFQVGSAATAIFLAVIVPALFVIQWLGGSDPQAAA